MSRAGQSASKVASRHNRNAAGSAKAGGQIVGSPCSKALILERGFARGRSYARRGQVASIEIAERQSQSDSTGLALRTLMRSRSMSNRIAREDWKRLAGFAQQSDHFCSQTLRGRNAAGDRACIQRCRLVTFPGKASRPRNNCSCPDWSNPCKHVAAVYYLLGEEFDRDPFLIFKLRGTDREGFLKLLSEESTESIESLGRVNRSEVAESLPREPLTSEAATFWHGTGSSTSELWDNVRVPPVSAALPKRLGNLPFWRGSQDLVTYLEPVYAKRRCTDLMFSSVLMRYDAACSTACQAES